MWFYTEGTETLVELRGHQKKVCKIWFLFQKVEKGQVIVLDCPYLKARYLPITVLWVSLDII